MKPRLDDVRWIELPKQTDSRGTLTSAEGSSDIPFMIRRVFYMHGTPPGIERGGHAHRDTQQAVVAVSGQFKMEFSDGRETRRFNLEDPNRALYMPPMVFVRLFDFSEQAVCLVLADTHYDRSQSIRSWREYLEAVNQEQPA